MHHARKITEDVWFVGGNDRRLAKFENCYPIPNGVSYNSYLVLDEKTVLLDTCDRAVSGTFLENIEFLLNGRGLDYIILNHMEPDHAATLADVLIRHPEATVVGNAKTHSMIRQFFEQNLQEKSSKYEKDSITRLYIVSHFHSIYFGICGKRCNIISRNSEWRYRRNVSLRQRYGP